MKQKIQAATVTYNRPSLFVGRGKILEKINNGSQRMIFPLRQVLLIRRDEGVWKIVLNEIENAMYKFKELAGVTA